MAAAEAGASAVIIYNDRAGPFPGSLKEPMPVPVLGLDGQAGQNLAAQAASNPVSVRVTVQAELVQRVTANVVAQRPGRGGRVLLIGGHYDSVRDSPGGNDNASGMAVVLELARVLSTYVLPDDLTLYVVAFGAEEDGLRGSRYFVDRLDEQQRQAVVAMLNYDMIGVGAVLGVGGSTELTDLAAQLAEQQGLDGTPAGSGDSAPQRSSLVHYCRDAGRSSSMHRTTRTTTRRPIPPTVFSRAIWRSLLGWASQCFSGSWPSEGESNAWLARAG